MKECNMPLDIVEIQALQLPCYVAEGSWVKAPPLRFCVLVLLSSIVGVHLESTANADMLSFCSVASLINKSPLTSCCELVSLAP